VAFDENALLRVAPTRTHDILKKTIDHFFHMRRNDPDSGLKFPCPLDIFCRMAGDSAWG